MYSPTSCSYQEAFNQAFLRSARIKASTVLAGSCTRYTNVAVGSKKADVHQQARQSKADAGVVTNFIGRAPIVEKKLVGLLILCL